MLKQFYGDVLPESGNYALFLLGPKQHLWAESVSGLADLTEARVNAQGVYFAVESFVEPTTRSQNNVQTLRSFRLDIDAGAKKYEKDPDGTYPTQRDALAAALDFFKASSVAPTYIVSSGEGLHVYYCLTEDVTSGVWLPIAKRLRDMIPMHGLKVDPTVTCDTARILRPPGSLHPNGSRVRILKNTGIKYSIAQLRDEFGVTEEPVTRKFNTSINDDVTSVEGPPKSAMKIVQHCAALREVAAVKGDCQEPLWRAMLGVVKFTTEGIDLAQEWSSGYDGYDPDEVDAKYEAWQVGPTSCAEFSRHTKACETCKHAGKIKSPIQLGYMTPEQVQELPEEKRPAPVAEAAPTGDPWDGHLPAGFEVKAINGVRTLVNKMKVPKEVESGEVVEVVVQVPVTEDIFWLGQWAAPSGMQDTAQVTLHRWDRVHGTVDTCMMDQTLAGDRYGLIKFLSGKAILVGHHKKAAQAMDDYIRASLQRIRGVAQRPKINDRFGVRIMPNGQLVAAQGRHVIYPDGRVLEAIIGDAIEEHADKFIIPLPANTTGEWKPEDIWPDIESRAKKYASFMTRTYGGKGLEKFQLAAMLGLASPLMAFITGSYHAGAKLPGNGLTVSLYSRGSGRGKTALTQAVMAAYGNPTELVKTSNKNGSTDIARTSKLSMWGTMPMSMDEMGNTKEASIANMISDVANGSGRDRGKQRGGFSSSPQWALINLATTNRAQRDMVGANQDESTAIQYRLLELNVEGVEYSPEARKQYDEDWGMIQRECSGAMGALIHRKLCEIGVERLNREVVAYVNKASELIGAKQDARFQFRALGAVLYLQKILTDAGLAMFSGRALLDEFKEAHDAGLSYIAESVLPTNGTDLMQMFLSDMKPHTLITPSESLGGKNAAVDIPLNSRIPDLVQARHVVTHGWSYVSSAALREWCIDKKISERDLMNDLKKAEVLIAPNPHKPQSFSLQVDLFKGTREGGTAYGRAIKVDVRKLALLTGADWQLVDDEKVTPINRKAEGSAAPVLKEATHE